MALMNCKITDYMSDTTDVPVTECPTCNGWGRVYGIVCGECDGKGTLPSTTAEAAQ